MNIEFYMDDFIWFYKTDTVWWDEDYEVDGVRVISISLFWFNLLIGWNVNNES